MLTFGSLFSGIGGIDLGFERAGMKCIWQVEIDDYANRVLAKHWPDVQRFRDVREIGKHNLAKCDVIAGGFPCQDISNAGKRAGIDGERSGLWREFHRIICEVRPRIVVVENVAALLNRGMGRVLGDLAASGYDAEWSIISAAGTGAPHIRERLFIVANSKCGRLSKRWGVINSGNQGKGRKRVSGNVAQGSREQAAKILANSNSSRLQEREVFGGNAKTQLSTFKRDCSCGAGIWTTEPSMVRVANGVPSRVDRLRGLGNAVVPQVAEFIGRRIVEVFDKQ